MYNGTCSSFATLMPHAKDTEVTERVAAQVSHRVKLEAIMSGYKNAPTGDTDVKVAKDTSDK